MEITEAAHTGKRSGWYGNSNLPWDPADSQDVRSDRDMAILKGSND
jgi:hypothetical protein